MECLHVMNTVDYKWEEGEVQTFLNLEIFRYGGIVSEQKKCIFVLQHIFVDCNDVYTLGEKGIGRHSEDFWIYNGSTQVHTFHSIHENQ